MWSVIWLSCLFYLAPQVGFEPTTLRLTAELQGEAVRIEKCKLLEIRVKWSCSHAALRMAFNKSSYKSSYSPFGRGYCDIPQQFRRSIALSGQEASEWLHQLQSQRRRWGLGNVSRMSSSILSERFTAVIGTLLHDT